MPRIADVLERESRTVDLEQGDFERLLGRRERKQRNRRIRAGALGVIVALAMGIVLVRSLTSDADPGGSARRAQAGAGGVGHPRVHPGRRRLRRRSGRVERGQDRGRPFRRGLRLAPTGARSGGGIDVVAGRAGTSPIATGTVPEPGVDRTGGRRDQRRGGQRARDVPAPRDGTSGGRRIPHASRCGTSRSRRSASTGSTALGRRSSRCRLDGDRAAITTRRGCRTGRWRLTNWELPLDGRRRARRLDLCTIQRVAKTTTSPRSGRPRGFAPTDRTPRTSFAAAGR